MKTSSRLGLIPFDLEPVDWIPVNKIAPGIAEIVSHDIATQATSTMQVYNIVNSTPVSWLELLPTVQGTISSQFRIVPFEEWIKELKLRNVEDLAAEKYPALKILDYFQERLDAAGQGKTIIADNMRNSSPALSHMPPVNET
jgi:hypothetical protein